MKLNAFPRGRVQTRLSSPKYVLPVPVPRAAPGATELMKGHVMEDH